MVYGIIIAVLLIIGLLLLVQLRAYSFVYIHLKDNILIVNVKTPFYRREIKYDLEKNKEEEKIKGVGIGEKEKTEQKSPLSEKIAKAKKRVFSSEKGFDTDELKNIWDEFSEMYSYAVGIIKKLLGKLRHKIHITQLLVRLEYGTDNPANTGMIYGSIWGLVGLLYPIFTRYFHIVYPTLDITPDFYDNRFDIEVRSIIKVRAAHIINAAFASLFVPAITYFKDKILKGREKNGR